MADQENPFDDSSGSPICNQELFASDKAKGLDTKELLANIYCALRDIACAIREAITAKKASSLTKEEIVAILNGGSLPDDGTYLIEITDQEVTLIEQV